MTKWFDRWRRKEAISDMALCVTVDGMERGLEQIPSRLNQSATTNLRNINKIEHDTSAILNTSCSSANPEKVDSFAMMNLRLKQIDRAFSVNQCEPEMP